MKNKIKELSISSLLAITIIFMCAFIATGAVSDNDLWWHLKTGEYIFNNKIIPTTDIFSFYGIEKNLLWIAHEWLSDLIIYVFWLIGGFKGLVVYPIILLIITLYITFYYYRKKYQENFLTASIWFFLLGLILAVFSSTRPHMFSFLLFTITVISIDAFLKNKSKLIWIIPLISFLWVNLHGGSSALLFVYLTFVIIFNLTNFSFSKLSCIKLKTQEIVILLKVFILSIITALVNPYTYKILLYPFTNMTDKVMLQSIVEWHSPDFHTMEGIVVFIIIFVPILYMIVSENKITLFELFIFLAFSFLSLRSIRQVVYFAIAMTPIIINFLPNIHTKNSKHKPYLNFIISLIIIALFSVNLISAFLTPVDTSEYPINAITSVEKYKPKRLLNDYNWGGFLIWKLHDEDIYPFIDGRADIFSKYTMKDYDTMVFAKNNWQDIFNSYDFDAVLMPKDVILTKLLLESEDWKIEYEDENTIFITKSRIS